MNKDQETIKIGNQTLNEDDLQFNVEYKGEMFTLVYPSPWAKIEIERIITQKLGAAPRSSYTQEHINFVEAVVYVNELIVLDKSPSWFKSALTCYDTELINTLYAGYLSFRRKFKDKLQTGGFAEGNRK